MIYRELLTATVTSRGDVLRHQPISEAKIIPELLPRQLSDIKAMRYSAKPCPIPHFPMEAVFLLHPCMLLPFVELGKLDGTFAKSHSLSGLTYACPMAYVVEDGTS